MKRGKFARRNALRHGARADGECCCVRRVRGGVGNRQEQTETSYSTTDGHEADRAGVGATLHTTFRKFLNDHCGECTYNKTLQSILSNVCGKYCLAYLLFRCRNVPIKTFTNLFDTDLVANDFRVFYWINVCDRAQCNCRSVCITFVLFVCFVHMTTFTN